MHRPTRTLILRRSFLARGVGAVCTLSVLALALQALAAAPSRASRAQAGMQSITLLASAPHFPKSFTSGLLSVTLINDTKSEVSAGFGHANPGETMAQVKAAVAASDSGSLAGFEQVLRAVTFIGGIDDVLPGTTEQVVLRLATPGLYGGGVSPSNGQSHITYFNVTAGAGAPAALPAGDVSVTLKDFKFIGLPKHLAAGNATFQLTNTSIMAHEMQLARLDPGKTQQDVMKFLQSPQAQNGPPPAWIHDNGGMDTLSPHQSAELTVHLVPGYYLVVCFMPDVNKHGEPHVMEGMIGHFVVQ